LTSSIPRVFTIPAGVAFADALAQGQLDRAGDDPLALAATTILLPTRRAIRTLTDAFLRVTGGKALLLPRLLALADLDGDQDLLGATELPPAIDPLRRHLILARLVMARGGDFAVAPDQALRLAQALAELIDEVETEQVDFARLKELAPETFAGHWQATIEFLRIVTENWPAILEQQGAIDPARRRVLAMTARAAAWAADPPSDPVIAAGFIAADPALAEIIAIVARMPQGMVVLPGLDQMLDNAGWDAVGATHPQWGMKRLLERIGIDRKAVEPWPNTDQAALPRARLLSEALRPAETTAAWRSGPGIDPAACAGLTRIDCATVGEEAEVIALTMRETLESPARTAALVTADRALARRVAAALKRWGIEVDDSAGQPLGDTPVGVWLRLLAEAAVADYAPRLLLALLKHPLAAGGLPVETMRRRVRLLERYVLRGPRPGPGLKGIRHVLDQVQLKDFDHPDEQQELRRWLDDLERRLQPLTGVLASKHADLAELLLRHAEVAEALAETPDEAGGLRLWRGQDGEAAADLLARLNGAAGADFPAVAVDRYPAVLSALMAGIAIRPLYGVHPRLAIWGLIEARLQRADLLILGGLNEGTWPPQPGDEPWMSRPMRDRFGLPPLEVKIGEAAQDFALAAAGPQVLMTRSLRVEGAPSVPARFLSRLETLLKGSGLELPHDTAGAWRGWAEELDRPDTVAPIQPPEPRPPPAARPRRLSVTAIELWRRDPYALYAQRILKLRPLDPLDADPGAAERGEIIHHALDQFISRHPDRLPCDALAALIAEGRKAFGEALSHPSVAAFWWPRFERVAAWFIEFEQARRQAGIRPLRTEITGGILIETDTKPFHLTAKADRIDRLPDGRLAILDYKTGRPPTPGSVRDGFAPQLPLEAVIAEQGGFSDLPKGATGELAYLRLTGGNPPGEFLPALGKDEPDEAIANAWEGLAGLIAAYDKADQPYRALVRAEFAFAGDYDHLSRIDEWAIRP
jgi:ATP-dependent helicase/nuclease subunit B